MFDKLFRSRAMVQRHLSSPLQQERLESTTSLRLRGTLALMFRV